MFFVFFKFFGFILLHTGTKLMQPRDLRWPKVMQPSDLCILSHPCPLKERVESGNRMMRWTRGVSTRG